MRQEAHVLIHLTERDIRLAAPDGGLAVDLPAGTSRVIIKVEREADTEKKDAPR